jgi:hypothetical protein
VLCLAILAIWLVFDDTSNPMVWVNTLTAYLLMIFFVEMLLLVGHRVWCRYARDLRLPPLTDRVAGASAPL